MRSVAFAYLGFAEAHSTLYDAMFTLPTSLRFAGADTKPEMRKAFAALVAVVPSSAQGREVAAETFWAALHGLALLERSGRIRPSAHDERVVLLVDRLFRDE
jgi:hypothetical protein